MLLALLMSFVAGKILMISIILGGSLGIAMYATWAERKVAAVMQDRRGPNRAGPFGLFHQGFPAIARSRAGLCPAFRLKRYETTRRNQFGQQHR